MIEPRTLTTLARSWIGTPYHHQARGPKGPGGGVDCVGLLIGVSVEAGLIGTDYDPTGYAWETDGTQLQAELSRWADLVAFSEAEDGLGFWEAVAQEGDIAVFRVAGLPQHTGFISVIDYGQGVTALGLIHAYNTLGKVVEHRLDDRWARRMIGLWRLRS